MRLNRRAVFSFVILWSIWGGLAALAAGGQPDTLPRAEIRQSSLPATGVQKTLLSVPGFGRYAITVSSPQGTALQLVDRLAGPGNIHGIPGKQDGRLDLFLDQGTSRIVTHAYEQGTGTAELQVHPFQELNQPRAPRLVDLKLVQTRLDDFQQRSYWIEVPHRKTVAIEAAGRNLADLRLWRDGAWLVDAVPEADVLEPAPGRPLACRRLVADLNPGLYLLTAYGGPAKAWPETSDAHPLYVRMGLPRLAEAGRMQVTTSPFGVDYWLVPRTANYFRLALPRAERAQLRVGEYDPNRPFAASGAHAGITAKSRLPVAEIQTNSYEHGLRIMTVKREAGKPYTISQFKYVDDYGFSGSGEYWISTLHSGDIADSIDATAMLVAYPRENQPQLLAAQAIALNAQRVYRRKCNLAGSLTLHLEILEPGTFEVHGTGVKARFRVEPFLTRPPEHYQPPAFEASGHGWELDAGYYVLTVEPLDDGKGILELTIRPANPQGSLSAASSRGNARFGSLYLTSGNRYEMWINRQPGVKAGVILRPYPIDLSTALPVVLARGETLPIKVRVPGDGILAAVNMAGEPVEFRLAGEEAQKRQFVRAGTYGITLGPATQAPLHLLLTFTPYDQEADTPLPPMSDASLEKIPEFPVLAAENPVYMDLAGRQRAHFRVRVDTPALYRLESTGLLETEGYLRTRTNPNLDHRKANGVGRNFLIQQYLLQGDYQLSARPLGDCRGHAGFELTQTPLLAGGRLSPGIPTRAALAPGQGLAYDFTIQESGQYRFQALGLGREFSIRLEDAQGWPLVPTGVRADLTRRFESGAYRVIILPQPVEARVVSLLEAVPPKPERNGHGPHRLSARDLQTPIRHIWLEPEPDGPRKPDQWIFAVKADVTAHIQLSDGMQGRLLTGERTVAEIPPRKAFSGQIRAGEYTLAVKSVRPNNRFEYDVSIAFRELTPGYERDVDAPASIPVSVSPGGVTSLLSFGDQDVRGRLYDADHRVWAENDDQTHDWNFLLSRSLPAGTYTLQVDPVGRDRAHTRVIMRSESVVAEAPVAFPADLQVADAQVHAWPLETPAAGQVLVAGGVCRDDMALDLEIRANDAWRPLASAEGREPLLAYRVGTHGADLRLAARSLEGRAAAMTIWLRSVAPDFETEKGLKTGLKLHAIDDVKPPAALGAVALARPGTFRVISDSADLMTAAATDRALMPVQKDLVIADGPEVVFVQKNGEMRHVLQAQRIKLSPEESLKLPLPAARIVTLSLQDVEGPCVLMANSRTGTPGLAIPMDSGTAMSAAMGMGNKSAVAVVAKGRTDTALLWSSQPSVKADMDVEVRCRALQTMDTGKMAAGFNDAVLKPVSMLENRLPPGLKTIRLALGPRIAAELETSRRVEHTLWSGNQGRVVSVDTAAEILRLYNASEASCHVTALISALAENQHLRILDDQNVLKLHFATGGVFRLPVHVTPEQARAGIVLRLVGRDADALLTDDRGLVHQGRRISLAGADIRGGVLDIRHGPGLVLLWMESADHDPWQIDPANALAVATDGRIALSGKALRLDLAIKGPRMLHLKTDVPVISRIRIPGRAGDVRIFTQAADLNLPITAGDSDEAGTITLYGVDEAGLAGYADVHFTAPVRISEGLGPKTRIAPGDSRFYTFELRHDGNVGCGVRGSADQAVCRLFDLQGNLLGTGVVQMHMLGKGTYLLAVDVPGDSPAVDIQPAVVGLNLPNSGPPDEVRRQYLELAGIK